MNNSLEAGDVAADGGSGVLVLGIGNILGADDGFGIRALEALQAGYEMSEGVELVDGGTQGLYLLPLVEDAARLIVFDALDFGLRPGTLKVVADEQVPAYLARKMSMHQSGLHEVLALARLNGRCPREIVLIGAQPADLTEFRSGLSERVQACVEQAVEVAVARLAAWGCCPLRRDPGTERG